MFCYPDEQLNTRIVADVLVLDFHNAQFLRLEGPVMITKASFLYSTAMFR